MNYIETEEKFTYKDFANVLINFFKEFLPFKWWIGASIILFSGIFLGIALLTKTTFPAKLTFVVKKNSANNIGAGVNALLGQFGFGNSSTNGINPDKLIEFTRSEKIVRKALFHTATVRGKSDFIANHLLQIYSDERVNWDAYIQTTLELGETEVANFSFQKDSLDQFTFVEQMFFDQLYLLVVGGEDVGGIMDIVYGEQSDILVLSVRSIQEEISIQLTEAFYQELSEFYIKDAIEGTKQAFQILQVKADSVLRALNSVESQLSYVTSLNESYLSDKEQLRRKRMNRDARILTIMYGEVLKNKETTAFMLQSQTPFFQVIDRPHRPIYQKKPSKLIALSTGAFLGLFVSIFFFFIRKVCRNVKMRPKLSESNRVINLRKDKTQPIVMTKSEFLRLAESQWKDLEKLKEIKKN